MKKVMAIAAAVLMAAAATATDVWTAPVNVTNTVVTAGVHIDSVIVSISKADDTARIMVRWTLKAADGSAIKTGATVYTEAQLDALLQSQGGSIAALRGLFLRLAAQEARK